MTDRWLRHSRRIARTEWTRHRRNLGGSLLQGRSRLAVSLALAAIFGWGAYEVGRVLASAASPPLEWLGLAASLGYVSLVVRSLRLTSARFSRLEPDLLLTVVPARTVALGLLGFVSARVAASIAGPTVGVAVGAALGLRSLTVAFTVVAAVAGLTMLAVAVGVAGRLAAHLVGTRLARSRTYRDLLALFGWAPVLAAWVLIQETSLSLAPLLAALETQPITWFVDLALLGAGDTVGATLESRRALGALAAVALAVAPLAGATTVVIRRLWEADPAASTGVQGSHALLESGQLERLLGERVSLPVRTVARKRWLVERRVPRGLLTTAYVFMFTVIALFPAFALLGAPLLLLLALAFGLATGLVFADGPIEVEYRGLPMVLTAVDGRQFVGGHLLAALVAGVPVVAAVVLPLGLASPAGVAETVALVAVGVATCACTASVAIAVGLDVDRAALVPVPAFFTDVRVYGELGSASFRRLGTVLAVASLPCLPAILGNSSTVYERATALGVPTGTVRIGSLLLTVAVAVGVSRIAFRVAVRRYRTYRLE